MDQIELFEIPVFLWSFDNKKKSKNDKKNGKSRLMPGWRNEKYRKKQEKQEFFQMYRNYRKYRSDVRPVKSRSLDSLVILEKETKS